jgi:pyridoxal phosphate enzyme (YggS family)
MVDSSAYRDRLAAVQTAVAAACRDGGRDPSAVRLLPVSKTHPPETLQAFISLGLCEFGENYAQEMAAKAAALAGAARFVFIGTLQSNKIKLIVQTASELQTLASLRHARLVAAAARDAGKTPYPVYLAVNAGGEASKSGLPLDEAAALAAQIARELPELDVQGLMAIPPPLETLASAAELASPQFVPPLYRQLAAAAGTIGRGLLSLGMTQDLRPAILAGSSCVRVGTALFGPRA